MRRRNGSLAIVLSVMLLMMLGLHAPPRSQAATPGIYIALGDSIAAGIGSSLPRERGNAALVAEWLAHLTVATVPHENLAVPGETASSFITTGQLDRLRDTVARTRSAGIPIAAVTISLGGNELLSLEDSGLSDRRAGLNAFQSAYADAISAIRSVIGGETPLVVFTIYDLSEGDATIQYTDAWWIEQFNEVVRSTAAEHNTLIADIAARFAGHMREFTHDPFDVHPNNAGHRVIAQTVWGVLRFDNEAPSLDIVSGANATRETPTIQFIVRDNLGVSRLSIVSADVGLLGPYELNDDRYAVLLDLSTFAGEEVAFMVEISDDAGNVTHQEVTVRTNVAGGGESQ